MIYDPKYIRCIFVHAFVSAMSLPDWLPCEDAQPVPVQLYRGLTGGEHRL